MFRNLLILISLAFVTFTQHARATDDLLVDGASLPADASIAAPIASSSTFQQRWSGVWVGAWDGKIRHILLVESVGEDGAARVVYAIGDNPSIPRSWRRLEAIVSERTLKILGNVRHDGGWRSGSRVQAGPHHQSCENDESRLRVVEEVRCGCCVDARQIRTFAD